MNSVWLAGGIFLITYALIVSERCIARFRLSWVAWP